MYIDCNHISIVGGGGLSVMILDLTITVIHIRHSTYTTELNLFR